MDQILGRFWLKINTACLDFHVGEPKILRKIRHQQSISQQALNPRMRVLLTSP